MDFAQGATMGLAEASKLVAKTLGSSTNALSRYGVEVNGAVGSNERLESTLGSLNSKWQLTQIITITDENKQIADIISIQGLSYSNIIILNYSCVI